MTENINRGPPHNLMPPDKQNETYENHPHLGLQVAK
jgi:hypothetical protein